MKDQPVGKVGPLLARNNGHEISLDADGIGMFCKPEPLRKARDMGIDDHSLIEAKGISKNDICRFASDARQRGQRIERARDFAAMLLEEN